MKRAAAASVFLGAAALLLILAVPLDASARGLVPCGGAGEPQCSACHFVVLLNNLTRWGIVNFALPVAGFMIVVAGLYYAFSGGDEKKISAAKNTLKNAIFGLFIVLIAWFLVDTAIKALVNRESVNVDNFNSTFGPWNNPFANDPNATVCQNSQPITPEIDSVETRPPETAIQTVGRTIANIFGTIILVVSVIMILIAALRFTTASEDEDTIRSARNTVLYALVGVAISLLAFVLPALVQRIF